MKNNTNRSTDRTDGTDGTDSTDATVTTEITVVGMTCGHCSSAVTSELQDLAGVLSVSVDLHVGADSLVTISSESPLDHGLVEAAVVEAGYELR